MLHRAHNTARTRQHLSYIIQIRNILALKDLDHDLGISDLSDARISGELPP